MKIWFTLTGTNDYYGQDFLKEGTKIRLEKEPDNRVDREAIKVLMDGIGHIGYVANSPRTDFGIELILISQCCREEAALPRWSCFFVSVPVFSPVYKHYSSLYAAE